MSKSAKDWAPGAKVARYTLLAKLATGGMAEIWLAEQQGLEGFSKLIVIKRILESYSQNTDFVSMFLDEARIAAQLNHPNIVQIFDLGAHGDTYYIAMEYLPGETLSVAVRGGTKAKKPMPPWIAARVICDAAAGLGHAHTKGGMDGKPLNIVHRDVSPQNLMITLDGNTKVVDFGVARAANRATQTVDGQIKGKIAYMSPEQAAGSPVDARCDVFALGVILFEAATSSRFFEDREAPQMVAMLCGAGPLPRAIDRNAEVPKGLSDIISVALHRDPAERYANGLELHEALSDWLHTRLDKVNVRSVEAWLRDVFQDRWGKRSELIESARAGLLTPSGLRKNLEKERDTAATMPGHTPHLATHGGAVVAPTERSLVVPIIAGAAIATLVGLGVGVLAFRKREPVSVPMPEAQAPQDPPIVVVLGKPAEPKPVEPPPKPVEPPPPPAPVAAVEPPQPKKPDPPRPVAAAKGKLTLQTTPVTEVFFGGKSLGETPLIEVTLPAGKQKLKLLNRADSSSSFVEVEVVAGKTTMKKVKL